MSNIPFNDNSLTLSDKINIITLSDKINIIQESIFGYNKTNYYLDADANNSIIQQLRELKENINALNTAAGFDNSYFPTISNIQSTINNVSTYSGDIAGLNTRCGNLEADAELIEQRVAVLESNNYQQKIDNNTSLITKYSNKINNLENSIINLTHSLSSYSSVADTVSINQSDITNLKADVNQLLADNNSTLNFHIRIGAWPIKGDNNLVPTDLQEAKSLSQTLHDLMVLVGTREFVAQNAEHAAGYKVRTDADDGPDLNTLIGKDKWAENNITQIKNGLLSLIDILVANDCISDQEKQTLENYFNN